MVNFDLDNFKLGVSSGWESKKVNKWSILAQPLVKENGL